VNPLKRLAKYIGGLFSARAGESAPPARARMPRVRGRYDAAQNSDESAQHWAAADGLSANAAHSPAVRHILRNRSRYESQNNGYCKGLLRTRRNDAVGTGPRVQVTLPLSWVATDPDFGTPARVNLPAGAAAAVERRWRQYRDGAALVDKLRVLIESGDRDGECFAVLTDNPALPSHGPRVDLRLYEADQVTTPDLWWNDPLAVDGIKFDRHGNPVEYHFLRGHPGDSYYTSTPYQYDPVPAAAVVHWYDPDRPNQARGIPTLTAALPLYAQLRRYTLAVLANAELTACITGVMENTSLPPTYDAPANAETGAAPTFDRVEFERGALLTTPQGWQAKAFDPAQPVAGYGEFKKEVLTESGAAANAPRNVSTKSSAEYNYSSARLDHIPYRAEIAIVRERLERVVLDRLFRAWLQEALLCPGYLPDGLPPLAAWEWAWQWDGVPSIDPVKDATADDIGLKNGTRTLSAVLADRGVNWEEHLRQRARELALAAQLEAEHGLAPGSLLPFAPPASPARAEPEPEGADAAA
jgi:lambda family phage portal protein